ncbi:MAG TPA: response regulator transcription factor [Bryobacteraceae bacterium]|nr:response regulator transcription factor [Bryobacteraceae bacterium]
MGPHRVADKTGRLLDGAKARILVVDDEEAIRRLLRASLSARGYAVFEAATGEQALEQARSVHPQVILLDLGLPDINGLEITRCVREWTQIPIIILSVHEEEAEKIGALDAGADDYLTKPFGPGELLARIRAALRRVNSEESDPVFVTGALSVDSGRREVRVGGALVPLTPIEYDLLTLFVRHAGKVLTHRQLVREVWGGVRYDDALHLLRVNISNVRRKLGDEARPNYILTEPGVGYRLRTEA